MSNIVGIASTDVYTSAWVCPELRELGLVFNLCPKMEDKFDILKDGTEEDEDWDDYDLEELVVKGTKQVYTQIGKMEKLEVLALDIDRSYENHMKVSDYAWNLTICDGYLDELARLKKLKSLQLQADFWSAMGQAEVEFMHKNWPLLSEITFRSESGALPPAVTAALRRNLSYIRTLDLTAVDDTVLQPFVQGLVSPSASDSDQDTSTVCTNLRRIKFDDVDDKRLDPASQHLVTLFSRNHNLTHLDLPYSFLRVSAVLAAVSELRHLQHLTIHSFEGEASCRDTLLLLKACLPLPELTELHFIDMDLSWDEVDGNKEEGMPDVESIIKEASIARFSKGSNATKIKSLRLPSNRYGARNPLPFLLLKSNLLDLETCEIPWFRGDADIKDIERIVRECCPNLKHLICPCLRGEIEHDGQAVRAFIRGCSGLESFTAELFSDYDAESFDPMFFDDDYSDLEPRLIITEVVTQHYKTLEVLDLTDCWQVSSEDQQSVLSQCRQLRRFWVTDSHGEGSMVSIESPDIYTSDWVCSELRELSLVLNLRPKCEFAFEEVKLQLKDDEEWEEDEGDEVVIALTTGHVYRQIGEMERLEVLALDIDRSFENRMIDSDYAWNLTVSGGSLDELVRLKNLRSLELKADFWSTMDQEDVEFMHKYWPLLSKITFNSRAMIKKFQNNDVITLFGVSARGKTRTIVEIQAQNPHGRYLRLIYAYRAIAKAPRECWNSDELCDSQFETGADHNQVFEAGTML
ncbi:hypothetical protein BGZ70_005642 [Mortierella alpina]|uniref:Uncharacterized protein n=1 Tax=Mortierella alpina TaxID=64518 RepID=A0A9P6J8V8_MORAP|nr:hypothetical protein BGZ70_005642 [Mortierella alpina]